MESTSHSPSFKLREVELDFMSSSNSVFNRMISSIHRKTNAGTWWSSLFLISSASLGVGILTLPYAISVAGLYLGILILILGMLVTSFSCSLLIECSHYSRGSPYYYILGNYIYRKKRIRLGTISESMLVIECYMSIVAYLIILQDLPVYALQVLGVTNEVLLSKCLWCGIFTIGVIYPLSLFTEISALRYTCLVSIISAGYIAIGLTIQCFLNNDIADRLYITITENPFDKLSIESLDIFPLVIFSYSCQCVILTIYDQLDEKDIKSGQDFINYGLLIVLMIYLITGIMGYITFIQDGMPYQFISSKLEHHPGLFFSVTSIQLCVAACLMILFRVHLSIYPCRDGIYTIFRDSMMDISKCESVVISTIIIPSAAVIALFVPQIEYLIVGLGSLLNPIVRDSLGLLQCTVLVLCGEV